MTCEKTVARELYGRLHAKVSLNDEYNQDKIIGCFKIRMSGNARYLELCLVR